MTRQVTQIRRSDEEQATWEAAAREFGVSLSAWIRSTLNAEAASTLQKQVPQEVAASGSQRGEGMKMSFPSYPPPGGSGAVGTPDTIPPAPHRSGVKPPTLDPDVFGGKSTYEPDFKQAKPDTGKKRGW